ncbi:patatin-like phospholipase family protein [Streptomyces zagrosensis]|uniref:NTE family protein n=1 Tax=Streptomyces zagrosensis TaxID=1042984 RepID=A0A7W9QHY5_9ACTN|nr:patatin-like phospholipase family protein [Streptomyces zagrosensis]MBB5940374.1 NTE family protein [Streptomyces zagrosensis]
MSENLSGAGGLPEPQGVALCLSGGGYRAMLFHVGALWRLNDAGWLGRLDFISSVSGGSITAGALGQRWQDLDFDSHQRAVNFPPTVVEPLRALARRTLDRGALLRGILGPGAGEAVAAAYRRHLVGEATLQDLPPHPRFVLTATNLHTGTLWRFSRPYMRDYRLGAIETPRLPLATAIAASSAFPPFLSPLTLRLQQSAWTHLATGEDERPVRPPREIALSDGGVYDNLGLEPVIKRCHTILVSDAGQRLRYTPRVACDWPRHVLRVLSVIDNQVRSLRKRSLITAYQEGDLRGAYWGIRSDLASYPLPEPLPVPDEAAHRLAEVPTRLAALPDHLHEQLINWGYAVSDAALRAHIDSTAQAPGAFPYPNAGWPR